MTSIITAWLVKLATRILRDKLTDKDDRIDHLENRLAFRERCLHDTEVAWKNEAQSAHSYGLQLADTLGRIETLSNQCDNLRDQMQVLNNQLANQKGTICRYQEERVSLLNTIDTLQANVSGWSKLFDEMKYRMGMSEDHAKLLRREIDVFTVQSPSTTGAGPASKASDSAGGSAGGTADGDATG